METRISLTEAEIIEALKASAIAGDGQAGITIKEIRKQTGWGTARARALVQKQIDAGRMEPCRVDRPYMDGRMGPVAGYRWIG